MLRRSRALVVCAALGAACDAGDDGSDVRDPCGPSDLYDEYAPGMEETGARMTVTLDRASPAPPEKGDNRWEISVSSADGEPMEDLEIEVRPFMPDHGHGTSTDPTVTVGEGPGEYVIEAIDLVMGGRWEISLTLDDDTGEPDEVVFAFCVLD